MAKYVVLISWNGPQLHAADSTKIKENIATQYEATGIKSNTTKFTDHLGAKKNVAYQITGEAPVPGSKSKVNLYSLVTSIK
jgi:hypothetical protein